MKIYCHAEVEPSTTRQFVRLHFKLVSEDIEGNKQEVEVTAGALTLFPTIWALLKEYLQTNFIYTEELVVIDDKV